METGFVAGFARAGAAASGAQGAAVMLGSDGAVRAMVGGRDYTASQFNRATQARRQPGSAFKPFVYLAAAEYGAAPLTRVDDSPLRIAHGPRTTTTQNITAKFPMLRRWLCPSMRRPCACRNTSAAQPCAGSRAPPGGRRHCRQVRPSDWALTPSPHSGWPALIAPFANGGYRVAPFVVRRIETADGAVIFERDAGFEEIAASRNAVASVNVMLEGVVEWGTGKAAAIPDTTSPARPVRRKTIATAWFVGHAGGLVCVVWVGRDDNRPMGEVTGGGAPAQTWRENHGAQPAAPLRGAATGDALGFVADG